MTTNLTLDNETLRTLMWCVVWLFTVQWVSIYAVASLVLTGRPLFRRRKFEGEEPRGLIPYRGRERES
jgi:hypothetical protein